MIFIISGPDVSCFLVLSVSKVGSAVTFLKPLLWMKLLNSRVCLASYPFLTEWLVACYVLPTMK